MKTNKKKIKRISKKQETPSPPKKDNNINVESVDGIVVVSQSNSTEELQTNQDSITIQTELDVNKYTGIISVRSNIDPENYLGELIQSPQYVVDQTSAQQSQHAAEIIRVQNEERAKQAGSQPKILKTKNNSVIAGFDTYDDIDINKIK